LIDLEAVSDTQIAAVPRSRKSHDILTSLTYAGHCARIAWRHGLESTVPYDTTAKARSLPPRMEVVATSGSHCVVP